MTHEEYELAASFWTNKDKTDTKMGREELKAWIDDFLSTHKVLALATGGENTIRATPLEYGWHEDALWIFSEGGLKFRGLEKTSMVAATVFDQDPGFGGLKSVQIMGEASVVEPFSPEYIHAAECKKIPLDVLKKLDHTMYLIKICPREINCLCSEFKKKGVGSRQIWRG